MKAQTAGSALAQQMMPHRAALHFWLPCLFSAGAAWLVFLTLGQTPLLRASGMAVAILGIAAALRHFGALLALIGGLTLAFTPAYWSQTGGTTSLDLLPAGGLALLGLLGFAAALLLRQLADQRGTRAANSLTLVGGALIAIGTLIVWQQVPTDRSLRLTTIFAAWVLFLVLDALLRVHARADDTRRGGLTLEHLGGLPLLLTLGILNDPLLVLLVPAVLLALISCKARLPLWYWGLLLLIVALGVRGVIADYVVSGWWSFSVEQAHDIGLRVPFLLADGWRYGPRWVYLFDLVIRQYTLFGVVLGVLGLARLARWYPPVGTVTMVAYAVYALFGLMYFGNNAPVLLLPLLMIQIVWITYAVDSVRQWLVRAAAQRAQTSTFWRRLTPLVFALLSALLFALLPAILLAQIISTGG